MMAAGQLCLAVQLVAVMLVFTAVDAAPKPAEHRLVRRSLDFSSSVTSQCGDAGLTIVECGETWKSNQPAPSDFQYLEKLCRETKIFYDCSDSAMTENGCFNYVLRSKLNDLKEEGERSCPSQFRSSASESLWSFD